MNPRKLKALELAPAHRGVDVAFDHTAPAVKWRGAYFAISRGHGFECHMALEF